MGMDGYQIRYHLLRLPCRIAHHCHDYLFLPQRPRSTSTPGLIAFTLLRLCSRLSSTNGFYFILPFWCLVSDNILWHIHSLRIYWSCHRSSIVRSPNRNLANQSRCPGSRKDHLQSQSSLNIFDTSLLHWTFSQPSLSIWSI